MRILPVLVFLTLLGVSECLAADERPGLSSVRNWLLLLNNDLDEDVVGKIAASDHDMVVVDHVSSQPGTDAGKSVRVVRQMQERGDGGRRLVIAYLNVGQAESYRRYWQKGWRVGAPAWVLGADPDGWQDNYPVAYWSPQWKELITGEHGLLRSIRDAGFDGVYLDWIGGFEDGNVLAAARRDHVDARREMIAWVREVSRAAKLLDPHFLVIAQNAATLLADERYLAAIDGVAHEDIWFTGADGGPEGDCAVPRRQADVGSITYISKLSRACRKSYRRDAANAMHFAGEEVLVPLLLQARAAGKTVFTVDYALSAGNVAAVHQTSRSLGFVPFTGARLLKSFADPVADSP